MLLYCDQIEAANEAKKIKVIRNCNLFGELSFVSYSIQLLAAHMSQTMMELYEKAKNNYEAFTKGEHRKDESKKS